MARSRAPRMKKSKKAARARKGKAAANTKVDQTVVLSTRTYMPVVQSPSVVNYASVAMSVLNGSFSNLTSVPEWPSMNAQYDEFCVTSVKFTYKPAANAYPPGASIDAYADSRIYTVVDRNGLAPIPTALNVPIKMLAYDSCKVFSAFKPWSRTLKCKPFWCNVTQPTVASGAPTVNNAPYINAGLVQTLLTYSEHCPVAIGELLGTITSEYRVKFRGKKPVSLSYHAASGSVIITPLSSFPGFTITNPPPTLGSGELANETKLICDDNGDIQVVAVSDGTVAIKGTTLE